ncbi:hypothetical protein HHK36_008221 [Tetracentron sinense]|uniref:Uncharacterized protein n=1 Tax=Tetracentron sinense TaxID=13715 RepID=A0A835DJU6_TETSI|nr:hypothetical protein HHK36_008221 [Tetracentron sinense]
MVVFFHLYLHIPHATQRSSDGLMKSNSKLVDEGYGEDEDEHSETLCEICGGAVNGPDLGRAQFDLLLIRLGQVVLPTNIEDFIPPHHKASATSTSLPNMDVSQQPLDAARPPSSSSHSLSPILGCSTLNSEVHSSPPPPPPAMSSPNLVSTIQPQIEPVDAPIPATSAASPIASPAVECSQPSLDQYVVLP